MIIRYWVSAKDLIAMHEVYLQRFGGSPGIKDEGLLLSGLEAPINLYFYGEPSVWLLAARYVRLAKNHAFNDGNKRAGYLAAQLFLSLNGLHFVPSQAEAVSMIVGFVAGDVSEDGIVDWIRACTRLTTDGA